MISFPRCLVASYSSPNGNIFYTGFFDMECILGQSWLSSNDQDSYIARVIHEQITGTFAKPNLVSWAGSKNADNSLIKIYPNPALDYVIAGIHISEDLQKATLTIKDGSGHVIKIIPIQHTDDQLVIPLHGLSPGVYSFLLSNNGVKSQSQLIVTGKK